MLVPRNSDVLSEASLEHSVRGLTAHTAECNNVALYASSGVVVSMIETPGSALLVLADGVVPLDPESMVFRAMLEGWACQQRARFLDERETIDPRLALVRRMVAFTGLYPWQWTCGGGGGVHQRSPLGAAADHGVHGAEL